VSQTYTSDTLRVSHDEITSHTTPSDINVLSAQARWQGVDAEKTTTTDDQNWNDSDDFLSVGETLTYDLPTPDPKYEFQWHSVGLNYDQNSINEEQHLNSVSYEFRDENDNVLESGSKSDITLSTGDTVNEGILSDVPIYTNHTGTNHYVHFYWDASDSNTEEIEIRGYVQTYSSKSTTDTYSTKDPYVTRDVDASYSGTLSDGEWSSWQDMTGLVEGTNEFYHNISGSNEAYIEFEYTYEEVYPTVQKQLRLYDADQNAIHTVALADPSDSQLDYNHHRYALNGTVYALDVVDPSDENAIDWVKWYHPTHGEYCPRAYDTIQL
jgi:hypothetical protein